MNDYFRTGSPLHCPLYSADVVASTPTRPKTESIWIRNKAPRVVLHVMGRGDGKRLALFDAGAAAFERQYPGLLGHHGIDHAVYICPICLRGFYRAAIGRRILTLEHVPPAALGGSGLVLTCVWCNNTAGTRLDAHARRKENIEQFMIGKLATRRRVQVVLPDGRLNASVSFENGRFQLHLDPGINKPGAREAFIAAAKPDTQITVGFQQDSFAELGAKISWLRSGYLAMFAFWGYQFVFDPALAVVREQIQNPDTRRMLCFTTELPPPVPRSTRRIFVVLAPDRNRGWAVQFGRDVVLFPPPRDMTFYERLASRIEAGEHDAQMTGQAYRWPDPPFFGQFNGPASSEERR